MRYVTLIIALVAIMLPGWSGEVNTEPQLPAAVERALDTYDADVHRAQADYRKEVDRAKEKASRIIAREQERATKAGDLELALAIKAKAEAVDKHTAGGLAKLDILGNKIKEEQEITMIQESLKLMEGAWDCKSGLSGNHFKTEIKGNRWLFGDGFTIKIDEKEKTVTFSNSKHTIVFPLPVTNPWIGTHAGGSKYVLTKKVEQKP